MKFTLTMNMDNAAFTESGYPEVETARILRKLSGQVAGINLEPGDGFPLMDANGNKVGTAEVTE